MILLWGLSGDDPLDEVRESLERKAVPFGFLDQRGILSSSLEAVGNSARVIRTGNRTIDLESVTAVYLRVYDWRKLPGVSEAGPQSDEWSHALSLETALHGWIETTNALVVNRPSAMASNASKPFQARIIGDYGFNVPDTLITTDPEAVRRFWERHRSVIYKSVSGVRSVVSRLSRYHLERLSDVSWCPTQFQEQIPGRDYRVNVVGEQIFACEIICEADDYRYASQHGASVELRSCELPSHVADRARALASAMQLHVAGIDLRCTPDRRWYCFEVNPSPGFTYYESQTGQPIADAIAGLLSAKVSVSERTRRDVLMLDCTSLASRTTCQ